jgi:hypothetical protein
LRREASVKRTRSRQAQRAPGAIRPSEPRK